MKTTSKPERRRKESVRAARQERVVSLAGVSFRGVLRTLVAAEKSVTARDGRWFNVHITPTERWTIGLTAWSSPSRTSPHHRKQCPVDHRVGTAP